MVRKTTPNNQERVDVEAKTYRDGEWLRDQYHGEGRSGAELAEQCGVATTTIYEWMDRHGVERRGQKDAARQFLQENEIWMEKDLDPITDDSIQLTEGDAAYIAGLLDGEGCIRIYERAEEGRDGHITKLTISNTDRKVIDWLTETVGMGDVYEEKADNGRNKPILRWVVNSREDLWKLIVAVEDHLRIKREEAMLLKAFIRARHRNITEGIDTSKSERAIAQRCMEAKA